MLGRTLFLLLVTFSSLLAVHRVSINISDLDLEAKFGLDLGQFNSDVGVDSYFVGAGIISTDDGEGDTFIYGNFQFINDLPDVEGMRFGMGMKFVFTNNGPETFIAMPVGMVADYLIPNKKNLPIFAVANIYYAPGPLSFSDATSYLELSAGIHYEMIENMRAYFGYRKIITSYIVAGDTYFNETLYGGMQIGF